MHSDPFIQLVDDRDIATECQKTDTKNPDGIHGTKYTPPLNAVPEKESAGGSVGFACGNGAAVRRTF